MAGFVSLCGARTRMLSVCFSMLADFWFGAAFERDKDVTPSGLTFPTHTHTHNIIISRLGSCAQAQMSFYRRQKHTTAYFFLYIPAIAIHG